MAAHPVETLGMLRKRGTDLELGLGSSFGVGGGDSADDGEEGGRPVVEVGGEPTYGHGESQKEEESAVRVFLTLIFLFW